MDTKSYLSQIERLDRMIQNKLSEIEQLKDIATSITVEPKEVNVQTSSDKDRIGTAVAKIVDLERETDKLVDEYIDRRKHIIKQIDGIDNVDYYHILSMRYVGKSTFENIVEKTHWSIRKVFSIHGKALQEFERIYGREYLENVQ